MKRFTVVVVFVMMVFIGGRSWGQNLVSNYSFEQIDSCPSESGQLNLAEPWFQPTVGTPDLMSHCIGVNNHHNLEVPANEFGYQPAKSGVSYAGFFIWFPYYDLGYREYIEAPLSISLQSGVKYFVSFYISLSDNSGITSDKIGAYFSADSSLSNDWSPLSEIPQIENVPGNFIIDTSQWVQIKGAFIAYGGERFITIGNFYNDANTDTISVEGGVNYFNYKGYFYIDDVCVSSDSLTCFGNLLEVETPVSQSSICLSPNPVQNLLNINFLSPSALASGETIAVYDVAGRKIVLPTTFSNNKAELTTTTLPNGIYLLQIINNKTGMSEVGKFVKE